MKEGDGFGPVNQQIINGISLGSIYALIALGYTMVYGIIKLINFAHGDIYMLGAYIGYFCMTTLKLGFLPSLFIAIILCMIVGICIEKIAYKPLRNATRMSFNNSHRGIPVSTVWYHVLCRCKCTHLSSIDRING